MDYREFIQLDLPVAVAIVSCGADWRVEEANAEFTDVLGYTEKELRETRPQKMVYDEDYANLVSVLKKIKQQNLIRRLSLHRKFHRHLQSLQPALHL